MKFLEWAVHTISLPVASRSHAGLSPQPVRHALILELTAEVNGALVVGWGECGVLSAPVSSPEYLDGVVDVTTEHLLPRLAAASASDELAAEAVAGLLAEVIGHRQAKAAIEMAILDAQLRAAGVSFKEYLGVSADGIPTGVGVPVLDSIPQLLDSVDGYLGEGYQRIKLKIRPGWDIEPVRAVREAHPDVPLQVDANSSYTIADADHLARLDAFGLLFVEQPFETDALRHHALLAQRIDTPVCLGGSISSASSAEDAIVWGAASIIKITPAHVGGYLEAVRLHDLAVEHGVPVWCGGSWETGVGRAANIALAGLPGFTRAGDISALSPFGQRDIAEPCEIVDGLVIIPNAPGLAPPPRRQRLAEATIETLRFSF